MGDGPPSEGARSSHIPADFSVYAHPD
jgi:hypothetical protein